MKNKKIIYRVVTAVFLIGFLGCGAWLIKYMIDLHKTDETMDDMRDSYVHEAEGESFIEPETIVEASTEPEPSEEIPTTEEAAESTEESEEPAYPGLEGYDVPALDIDFAGLQENENEDIYAWINVPGTKIDYPVLQDPEDVSYYLNHNLDGSKGYPGCIYTELYNSTNWDDNNTVLYGHNMKNGSMFATLHYFEDEEFFNEHSYVYIYSPDNLVRVYQIFAAYEFSNAHLLLSIPMSDPEFFASYLEGIPQNEGINNHFNTEIELTAEDKIITLETCIANKSDRRYLVQAVLVAEGELQNEGEGEPE